MACYTVTIMKSKTIKIIIFTAMLSLACCFTSFAAGKSDFPFKVEFDLEEVNRVCYAGHNGSTVNYKDGLAVLPDTFFNVELNKGITKADVKKLSASISIIYEKEDQTGSYKETVRTYDEGDLAVGDYYQILSENTIASLEEREKLYSDTLQGMVMTLNYDGSGKKNKTLYLYICDEDDYYSFQDAAQN